MFLFPAKYILFTPYYNFRESIFSKLGFVYHNITNVVQPSRIELAVSNKTH